MHETLALSFSSWHGKDTSGNQQCTRSTMLGVKGQAGAHPKCPRHAEEDCFQVPSLALIIFLLHSSRVWLVRPQCPPSMNSLLSLSAALLTVIPVTGPVLEDMPQLPRSAGNHAGHWGRHLLSHDLSQGSLLLLTSGSQVDRRKEPRMIVMAAPWVSRLLHFFFIPGLKKKKTYVWETASAPNDVISWDPTTLTRISRQQDVLS